MRIPTTIYRAIGEDLPLIESGRGCWLYDDKQNYYLDMSCGACCTSLGHSNAKVINAIIDQVREIPTVFSGFWMSEPAERAGQAIRDEFERANPGWFGGVIFQNGGGEAVDLTCKLASQYHMEAGQRARVRFASLRHSFHGVGTLPLSLSGDYPRYHLIQPFQYVAEQYIYHVQHPLVVGEDFSLAFTRKLPNTIAAFVIEPVGGPAVGAYPHTWEYLQELRNTCDEKGMLLIFDEVLCGSGRCGSLSVAMQYRVWPDIIILGKGLAAGYQPMSAICLSKKVVERIASGSSSIMFGTAFSGHTTGCAAVAATLDYLHTNNLYQRVLELESEIKQALGSICCTLPVVKCFRGKGCLWGLEFHDPTTGLPFPPDLNFHALVRKECFAQGIVVYSKGQTVNGVGDFLTIAPPFEIQTATLRVGLERIGCAIAAVYDREMARRR